MKVVRHKGFITHGESGVLSNPHVPLGTLTPKRIVRTKSNTPEKGTWNSFRSWDSNTKPMAAMSNTSLQLAPMDRGLLRAYLRHFVKDVDHLISHRHSVD